MVACEGDMSHPPPLCTKSVIMPETQSSNHPLQSNFHAKPPVYLSKKLLFKL